MIGSKEIYKPFKAAIIEIIDESPLIKTFVLEPECDFSFKTGEFVEITVDGIGEAPFTPSSSPLITETFDVTVMRAGYVTKKLHSMKTGDVLGVRGPYGRGYPVERFRDKEILILSGGCGLAPIRSLLFTLIDMQDQLRKVTLCYGSKTPKDCIYKPLFSQLNRLEKFQTLRTVDHGDKYWEEHTGVATVLLDHVEVDLPHALAVVCGPPVMMKFGTMKLLDMGFPDDLIYLSMEKNMSCGLGKCGHCMMGSYFVCRDGPVFTYNEIKDQPHIW